MNKISLSQGQINDLVVTYELDLTPTWWWWWLSFWWLFDFYSTRNNFDTRNKTRINFDGMIHSRPSYCRARSIFETRLWKKTKTKDCLLICNNFQIKKTQIIVLTLIKLWRSENGRCLAKMPFCIPFLTVHFQDPSRSQNGTNRPHSYRSAIRTIRSILRSWRILKLVG